jgi:glucokinase
MDTPLLLGIEIGGTKIQLGLGRGDGRLTALERRAVEPAHGASGILSRIPEILDSLLGRVGATREAIDAVGIGFGGPVDAARGIVTRSHQVPGWDEFPLADWARQTLGMSRVVIHNDADTAGLGECRFGSGVGLSPVLYITVGSGIGGGLIIDGQIYRGAGAGALEIGHLWVIDRSTSDLDVVKLEDIASGWAIDATARRYAESHRTGGRDDWLVLQLAGGDLSRIDAALVAEAARQGDREARFLLSKAVYAMSRALNQAVTLVAPRRIILGGGVSRIGEDLWLGPIRAQLDILVFPPFRGTFDLVPAALGDEVVVQGALALARDAAEADAGEPRR